MRTLHCFDCYLPATLGWVSDLLKHLRGAEVEIAAPWIIQNEFYKPSFRYHEFPLQRRFFPKVKTEAEHRFWQRLFSRSQRRLPTYTAWLERQLRAAPPDLLHAHFGPTGCLYLPLAKKLRRPLLVSFYGFDYRKLLNDRPVFRQKYRELFARSTCCIALGPMGAHALEDLGCPPEKIALVPPGIDTARFHAPVPEKPTGQLRLVQLATFTGKKGHLHTLRAFCDALPHCPGLHLTLAGEPYEPRTLSDVRGYISAHHLENRITLTGPVPSLQVPDFLSNFDVFIHPSRHAADGDHEVTPLVLLEAQAAGLPVLATRHMDLPSEVLHEHTGLLVEEGDIGALTAAIRYFYHMTSEDYQHWSATAHRWATEHFSIANSAQALFSLYQKIR